MARIQFYNLCTSVAFPALIVFALLGGVQGKEFPAESDDGQARKEVIEVPPVDTNTLQKQEAEERPQPSETGPGLERDTDDPQDIVHTRELLKNMKPGPGVQWRLTMPVPLEETEPDLRRRRRHAGYITLQARVAREALHGDSQTSNQQAGVAREAVHRDVLPSSQQARLAMEALQKVALASNQHKIEPQNQKFKDTIDVGKRNGMPRLVQKQSISLTDNERNVNSASETKAREEDLRSDAKTETKNIDDTLKIANRAKRRNRRRRRKHKLGKRSFVTDGNGTLVSETKAIEIPQQNKMLNDGKDNNLVSPLTMLISKEVNSKETAVDLDGDVSRKEGQTAEEGLMPGKNLFKRIAREALQNVGSDMDVSVDSLLDDEDVDRGVAVDDIDSGEIGSGGVNDETVAVGDDDIGEGADVDVVDGAGDELDTGDDVRPGTGDKPVDGAGVKLDTEDDVRPGTGDKPVDGAEDELDIGDDVRPGTGDKPVDGAEDELDTGDDVRPGTGDKPVDGAVDELDTGDDVRPGMVDKPVDEDSDNLDDAVVYNDNGEIGEELSDAGGAIPQEDDVDYPTQPVAKVQIVIPDTRQRLGKDYDTMPPVEPIGSVRSHKVKVHSRKVPVVTNVSNKKGKKIFLRGKLYKKLRLKALKTLPLHKKDQDEWYEEQAKKAHKKKLVKEKTLAELRRKIEGNTDETPHPKKLSNVMKEKRRKASYKRILDKGAAKTLVVEAKPKSQELRDYDLAKTMHRLEHKVDAVMSMIESGLGKKSSYKKVEESNHGRRHKRSVSQNFGINGDYSGLGGSSDMSEPKPVSSIENERNNHTKRRMKEEKVNKDSHSPPVNDLKGNHTEKEDKTGATVPLPQTGLKVLNLSSDGRTIENDSRRKSVLQEGVISMSIPTFDEPQSDGSKVEEYHVKSEDSEEISKHHHSPTNIPNSSQPNFELSQKEIALSSSFSNSPKGHSVSVNQITPPRLRPAQSDISSHKAIFSPFVLKERWREETREKNDHIIQNILKDNFGKVGRMQSYNRKNVLHNRIIPKLLYALTTDIMNHVQDILYKLNARGTKDDRFKDSAILHDTKGRHAFFNPRVYDTVNKKNSWNRLVKETLGVQERKRQMQEVAKAAKIRMKDILKHISNLKNLEKRVLKKMKPIAWRLVAGTTYELPFHAGHHRFEELVRHDIAKRPNSFVNQGQNQYGYPQRSSMLKTAAEKRYGKWRKFGRRPHNRIAELSQAMERLSNKADVIEKRLILNWRKGFGDGPKDRFMRQNKGSKLPDSDLFLHGESRKPLWSTLIGSSGWKIPLEYNARPLLKRNYAKIVQLEGLVKNLIKTLCGHRKRRLRRLRDLSWSHWMDEKEKEKSRQKQGIKPEKDPMSDEEYELERQLKDLLARFPMSEAENAMNNNLRREDSKIAAASDVLKAVIERNSDEDQEEPVMGSSAAVEMLSHGARRKRRVVGDSHLTGKTRQEKLYVEGNMYPVDQITKSQDKFQHGVEKANPVLHKSDDNQGGLQTKKLDGKMVIRKSFDHDSKVSSSSTTSTTTTPATLANAETTKTSLAETGWLEPKYHSKEATLNRAKRMAMKQEAHYGFGMLFGGDPDYFDGDFNEINEYDDYEGEENLLRRRLIGTPPYMSGYYMHSDLFPGYYTYHPPGVYKRSVGDRRPDTSKSSVEDDPSEKSTRSVDNRIPVTLSKRSVGDNPSEMSKRSLDDHKILTLSKRSTNPSERSKRAAGDNTKHLSRQQQAYQKLLKKQEHQQQPRYDDLDLDDSAEDVDDYDDEEDLEDYEDVDDEQPDDDDDDDDDDEEDDDEGTGDAVGRIQVEDNGESVEPEDEMVYTVEKSQINEAVEEPLSWGEWSICSVTCGLGQRYRVSICGEDGEPCHGRRSSDEIEVCQVNRDC